MTNYFFGCSDFLAFSLLMFYMNSDSRKLTYIIGGHGFWVKGGVYTLGVSEKNSAAASGSVHRGVNFRKNLEF